ncbi:MAG: YlxR family protein [Nocardioides sp.]
MARDRLSPARAAGQPVRTCIGCRDRATTRELLRVVAGLDASGRPAVLPDPDGTAPGRGAHLHPTSACYDLAVRRRAFARALRLEQGLASTPVGDYLASHTN